MLNPVFQFVADKLFSQGVITEELVNKHNGKRTNYEIMAIMTKGLKEAELKGDELEACP